MVLYILGVDLGNDQGYIFVQTEGGGVIHKHSAGFDNGRGKFFGNIILSCAENNVNAFKGLLASQLNGHILTTELQGLACAPGACQGDQLTNGEVALLQNVDHFLSYSAGGAQDSNGICLHCFNLTLQSCHTAHGWRT